MLFNLHMMYLILLKLAGGLEYIFITCIATAALHLSNTSPRFDNGAYSICKLIVVYCCTLFDKTFPKMDGIVVQWLALLSHNEKVLGVNLLASWSQHALPMCASSAC